MQNSEVRGVRAGGEGGDSVEGGSRLLDSRAFLFHHAHTRDGYRLTKGCKLCSGGVQGVSVEIEEGPSDKAEIHEGGGADETGAAPPSLSGGWDAIWKGYPVQG